VPTECGPGRFFNEALDADLADLRRGTTREGIHLGAMAGTVDLLLRCYTGLETRDGQLWLHQTLPPELGQLRFHISFRNHSLLVDLTPSTMVLESQPRSVPPIRVRVDSQIATLRAGHTYRFALDASDPPDTVSSTSVFNELVGGHPSEESGRD
jgi:trehalose/maltose hydrolase-like predicted phosphorylase